MSAGKLYRQSRGYFETRTEAENHVLAQYPDLTRAELRKLVKREANAAKVERELAKTTREASGARKKKFL